MGRKEEIKEIGQRDGAKETEKKWNGKHKEKNKIKLVKTKYEEQKKPKVENEKNTFNRETGPGRFPESFSHS